MRAMLFYNVHVVTSVYQGSIHGIRSYPPSNAIAVTNAAKVGIGRHCQ